ncbi:MAG: serine dehydrogenasease [Bacilli bacterium]|nr:serine dehydrogenasease [Bacilli bacterium]
MNENKLAIMNTAKMKNLLNNLEKVLDGNVLVYFGGIDEGIEIHIKDMIEQIAKSKFKKDKLFVILTTNGGSLGPVQRMMTVFRHHYKEVNFIVPDYAYSAGTVFCMGGDNILMNYYSILGPIDPQVKNKEGHYVAALGYLDKINELLDKANNNTLSNAEFVILKDFDLAELRLYEQAKELNIDILTKWLCSYKFKTWTTHKNGTPVTPDERKKRAEEIAGKLSDNKIWKTHGRPIDINMLRNDLKLKIEDYGTIPVVGDAIDEYYKFAIEYMKNNKYTTYFQTRFFI